MEIFFSSNFLRKAKKLPKKEKIVLSERTETFRENIDDSKLKAHPLKGKLKGLFAFSLDYSKRVIFVYIGKSKVLFVDVGIHDEVYK